MSNENQTEFVRYCKHYQERLLQVTTSNRSVLLRKVYKSHNFDTAQLEEFKEGTIGKITSKALKNLHFVFGSKTLKPAPVSIILDSVASDDADAARARLKFLSRNLARIEEETGQQVGYLGFPFLRGHVTPDFYVRGPLVLFPISLARTAKERRRGWVIEFASKRPILNGALLMSLKKKGGYSIPEDYEESFDEMIEDAANATDESEKYFFDCVCRWVEKVAPIDAASNVFDTARLPAINRDTLEKIERQRLHVVNYKILGNFPQADSQIYKDYNHLINNAERWPGVAGSLLGMEQDRNATPRDNLEKTSGNGSCDLDRIKDMEINTVLESDSSQDEVIVRSKDLDLLVVRGPPGTGKSQVIVNLIADALTNNKKVLVVCQKRAALEVVRQRLESVGLDRYVGFLAKEIDDRTALYKQMHGIITQEPDMEVSTVVENISREIDSCVEYLAELGSALRKEYFGGATAHKIYTKADGRYRRVLDFSPKDLGLTWQNLDKFIARVKRFEEQFRKFEDGNHPWFGRKDFSGFGIKEESQLDGLLQELLSIHPECLLAEDPVLQAQLERHFAEHRRLSSSLEDTCLSGLVRDEVSQLDGPLQELLSIHPECLLAEDPVLQAQLERCMSGYQRNKGIRKRSKRKSYAKDITAILSMENLDKDFVDKNVESVSRGIKFWEKIAKLPERLNHGKREELERQIKGRDTAIDALRRMEDAVSDFNARHDVACKIGEILNMSDGDKAVSDETLERVKHGIQFWEKITKLFEYFGDDGKSRLRQRMKGAGTTLAALKSMKKSLNIDELQRFDKEKAESKEILTVLEQAKERMKRDDNWSERIREEVYLNWLACIEQENPILKGSHADEYQRKRKELAELLEKKKKAVKARIQSKIEGVIHPDWIYGGRSSEDRVWRRFTAELKKKRKVNPVRKTFTSYSEQMFQVTPCWLASPESVSGAFPMRNELFDLTIVDEASQLAVERSIPFLYRSKHVVVAGDEKQLSPFDLFQVIEDEDDDDMPEEKSLLELAHARFRTFNLLWHYRSQHQDLINFSNQAFYDGTLNVAPSMDRNPKNPPIRWIQCNGMWENNINRVEAKRVVKELKNVWKSRFEAAGDYPSVGIITFNDRQRDAVQDEVDKMRDADPEFAEMYGTTHKKNRDKRLFVKNIENVQGDERDIIIFSIGYARDPNGVFAQLFGSLSKKGGENRLNVAITRARKEMVVACSIDPNDMKPTSKNNGPRRLRQFLQYAKATASQSEEVQKSVLKDVNPDMGKAARSRVLKFDSDFEKQVFEGLLKRGYRVDTQVGESGYAIDLAVRHPDDPRRYIVGIECDGATFHSARSVKERDVMRQKFLEGRGWKIKRIWSRNWWRDPNYELSRIDETIKNIRNSSAVQTDR